MSDQRDGGISWTDHTWNPTRGCSRISPGCGGAKGEGGCYAERQAYRFSGPGQPYEGLVRLGKQGPRWTGKMRLESSMLTAPLRWMSPQRIFVNSMSDLFHEELTDEEIDQVFGVMWACRNLGRAAVPGHVFQVLTKRAARMADYLRQDRRKQWAHAAVTHGGGIDPDGLHDQVMFAKGPHPRIWLGVSVENQEYAEERIPFLLEAPASVRFLSCEPLLGPVDVRRYMWPTCWSWAAGFPTPEAAIAAGAYAERKRQSLVSAYARFIDWVIVGGESGPGARPFALPWALDIVRQCREASTAVFVKQLGARPFGKVDGDGGIEATRVKLVDRKGGDWDEWPWRTLVVREFPEVAR